MKILIRVLVLAVLFMLSGCEGNNIDVGTLEKENGQNVRVISKDSKDELKIESIEEVMENTGFRLCHFDSINGNAVVFYPPWNNYKKEPNKIPFGHQVNGDDTTQIPYLYNVDFKDKSFEPVNIGTDIVKDIEYPYYSPDKSKIAIVDRVEDNYSVVLLNRQNYSDKKVLITQHFNDIRIKNIVWSEDSSFFSIFYVKYIDGSSDYKGIICIYDIMGNKVSEIEFNLDNTYEWPDSFGFVGNRKYMYVENGVIKVRDIYDENSSTGEVAEGSRFVLSHDKKHIVRFVDRDESSYKSTIKIDSLDDKFKSLSTIKEISNINGTPVWSPDSTYVAFFENDILWALDVKTAEKKLLLSDINSSAENTFDNYKIFWQRQNELYVHGSANNGPKTLYRIMLSDSNTKGETEGKISEKTSIVLNDRGIVLGGSVDNVWKSPGIIAALIKGDESYQLYSQSRSTGKIDGGNLKYRKQLLGSTTPYLDMELNVENDEGEIEKSSLLISCDWDPLPRIPSLDDATKYHVDFEGIMDLDYKTEVIKYLTGDTKKALLVDFEGDGLEEILLDIEVNLESIEDNYAKENLKFCRKLNLIVLQKDYGGRLINHVLSPAEYLQAGMESEISFVADVDGDGKLEILVRSYYESKRTVDKGYGCIEEKLYKIDHSYPQVLYTNTYQ